MFQLIEKDYIRGGTQKKNYSSNEIELCNCPLCDQNNFTVLAEERGLKVTRCNNCELIYTNPRAKQAQENYFGDITTFFNEARLIFSGKKTHHRDKNYEYELAQIKKVKPNGNLLDIGTNMGFFLRKARDAGYQTEGVEPSPALAKIATENFKLKIHNSFLESATLPDKNYDVITLIDVLEHVTNPKQILKSCYNLLKDDGIIVVKVPNGDYNEFKWKLSRKMSNSADMDIWDCYEHVVHYAPYTFKRLADDCGYKLHSFFIPLPIHSPVWGQYVGHYYQYPSPFVLDWKRIIVRNLFYYMGKIEKALGFKKLRFAPDLMFILKKK